MNADAFDEHEKYDRPQAHIGVFEIINLISDPDGPVIHDIGMSAKDFTYLGHFATNLQVANLDCIVDDLEEHATFRLHGSSDENVSCVVYIYFVIIVVCI